MLKSHGKIHVHLVPFKPQMPEITTEAHLVRVFLAQNRQFLVHIECMRFSGSAWCFFVLFSALAACVVSILKALERSKCPYSHSYP